jgi:hypothetical protein
MVYVDGIIGSVKKLNFQCSETLNEEQA